MPGYLPGSDPIEFDEWAEALAFLVDELEEAWDRAYEVRGECIPPVKDEDVDAAYLDLHTELHNYPEGKPMNRIVNDPTVSTPYFYWIEPIEEGV